MVRCSRLATYEWTSSHLQLCTSCGLLLLRKRDLYKEFDLNGANSVLPSVSSNMDGSWTNLMQSPYDSPCCGQKETVILATVELIMDHMDRPCSIFRWQKPNTQWPIHNHWEVEADQDLRVKRTFLRLWQGIDKGINCVRIKFFFLGEEELTNIKCQFMLLRENKCFEDLFGVLVCPSNPNACPSKEEKVQQGKWVACVDGS